MAEDTTDREREGDANLSYEEAVAALESIVEQIERGEIGLEQSIQEYERGVRLVARCRDVLARAEQRIIELDGAEGGAESPVE